MKELEKIEEHHLPPLAFDDIACKACRETNLTIIKDESAEPNKDGNLNSLKYKELLGSSTTKTGNIEEFTYTQWSSSATDIILLNLLNEYEKLNSKPKEEGAKVDDRMPALLDPLTLKVGLSFHGHKKLQNIFQLVYVRQLGNQML